MNNKTIEFDLYLANSTTGSGRLPRGADPEDVGTIGCSGSVLDVTIGVSSNRFTAGSTVVVPHLNCGQLASSAGCPILFLR